MDVSGAAAIAATSVVAVGAGCAGALLQLAHRDVSWTSFITSLLGFLLSFGTVALVPYDVRQVLCKQGQQGSPGQLVTFIWDSVYWTTFFLAWVVCPILIQYEAAGNFTVSSRLQAAFNRSAGWGVAYFAFGLLLLIWLIVGGGIGLRAWCIAASTLWGLLLSTVLMGYGLVALPQHFWCLASPREQLAKLYYHAVPMDEAKVTTQFELQDVISEARMEMVSRNVQIWDSTLEHAFAVLQQTLEDCELLHSELTNGARRPREGGQSCGVVPRGGEDASRLETLGELHRALKQAGLEARRAACRWDRLVHRCILLEDIEERMYPSPLELATSWQGSSWHMLCRSHALRTCWHSIVLLWLESLRTWVLRFAAFFCGFLSGIIVLGQMTMSWEGWPLPLLASLFREDHGFWRMQLFCLLPLGYMLCVAYWSVFRLKIAGLYGLYPHHNTDTISLLWCASILARLAAPLCYHFLCLVRMKDTALQRMMGQMHSVPVLGGSFNGVFPVLVAFLCICNVFNLYSRILQRCGLDMLAPEWATPAVLADTSDLLAEGRRLVERERRRRSEDRSLLELREERGEGGTATIPLRLQIAALIEDGTLPLDWNAASPP